MIFSSLQYLIFLPIVVFLYWRTRGGARLAVTVLASYFFYMSWLPAYGILLFALTVANWLLALGITRFRENRKVAEQPTVAERALLWLGILLNVGCLSYYKYTNFVLENLAASLNAFTHLLVKGMGFNFAFAFNAAPPTFDFPVLHVLLPLGISFFVFEFVHYLADVYKGSKPIRSFMEFTAFASFFPSQIAGPIKRYQDFNKRLRHPQPWSMPLFYEAMGLIVQGLFKKVALADPINGIIFPLFNTHQPLFCGDALIATIGFYLQVYCDFSGYTDIGRGSALLLGIRLPENFNLPYLAQDLGEFWRRWHMSLSFWLRDYVYIPLGGSRGGKLAHWRNLFITMLVCGLWHGASWHYVVFGASQGVGLIVNREWQERVRQYAWLKLISRHVGTRLLTTFMTMAYVALTEVIFRAPDVPRACNVLSSLARFNGDCLRWELIEKSAILPLSMVYFAFWLILELAKRKPLMLGALASVDGRSPLRFSTPVRLSAWTAAAILMVAAHPNEAIPFVYFQF